MDLDFEPVYCVEQIKVPLGLPNLLKKFTKEVLRQQPASLEEFAFSYFQKLLKDTKQNASAQPPSLHQLQSVWNRLEFFESAPQSHIYEVCSLHGIALTWIDRVFQLSGFTSESVDPKEVVVLLITTTVKSFTAELEAIFKVFGHDSGSKLPTALLLKLLSALAKRDRDIKPESIMELTNSLRDEEEVTFHDIRTSPHLEQYFNKQ